MQRRGINGLWKTGIILYLMFVTSFVIHEGVHVWQCYDDPNATFKGFTWTWTTFYVVMDVDGKPKYDYATAEAQAYIVQFVALSVMFIIYLLKKEIDKQIAEEMLEIFKKNSQESDKPSGDY